MFYQKYRIQNSTLLKHAKSVIHSRWSSIDDGSRKRLPLSRIHDVLSGSALNEFRIACFDELNRNPWVEWFYKDCSELVAKLIGPDFCIQSKLNLSIVPPRDRSSQLPIHSDSWAGDSPFQLNFWFPLTDAVGDSGIYIVDPDCTLDAMQYLQVNGRLPPIKKRSRMTVAARVGDVIVFNPALLHGSGLNTSTKTRLSLNLRVKNFFAPDFSAQFPDRNSASYYAHTVLSDATKFGVRFWGTSRLKIEDAPG